MLEMSARGASIATETSSNKRTLLMRFKAMAKSRYKSFRDFINKPERIVMRSTEIAQIR